MLRRTGVGTAEHINVREDGGYCGRSRGVEMMRPCVRNGEESGVRQEGAKKIATIFLSRDPLMKKKVVSWFRG
ncbi:hypothetical protein KFK09_026075 [Dendrobium nobile]|uniref:Uncharacterized protein n=1 Tax=Dendrobium nobile TaxID=94219 RepID=A0A8T3ABU6_DENNO|nr:hypothetical protein KFK09_026066 [Dendrobium nobile]KAI0491814.1 hypothetical protein KFK09_026075 [Dendrobium nobile]